MHNKLILSGLLCLLFFCCAGLNTCNLKPMMSGSYSCDNLLLSDFGGSAKVFALKDVYLTLDPGSGVERRVTLHANVDEDNDGNGDGALILSGSFMQMDDNIHITLYDEHNNLIVEMDLTREGLGQMSGGVTFSPPGEGGLYTGNTTFNHL